MKKRMISLLLALTLCLSLLPVMAMAAATNVRVTGVEYYDSGALKSITATFGWSGAQASCRLVLMTTELRAKTSDNSYGDYTDWGTYGRQKTFTTFQDVLDEDQKNGAFGIISKTNEQSTHAGRATFTFTDTDIPLSENKTYFVNLWTWGYAGCCYPDNLICVIRVQDGEVRYTVGRSDNTYDIGALQIVERDEAFDVTIKAGANMTKTSESGSETQNGVKAGITPVVYTADMGYYFPEDYAVDTVNGIMVRRDSATQITVYGTPTADVEIKLNPAVAGEIDPDETWTVTFETNGGSAVDSKTVTNGSAVAAPVDPTRDGYTFAGWYKDAECSEAYDFTAPVTENITLYAKWTKDEQPAPELPWWAGLLPALDDELPFTDVQDGDWFYDDVRYVYGSGLMNGTSATKFSPNASTTRGMVLTILARMEGVNTSGTPWYAAGRDWAVANGISDGTDMEGSITREQLAAILYRYASFKGRDAATLERELSAFADADSVSGWALDAMQWAVGTGLISGSNGLLRPQSNASRAEVAAILARLCEQL